MDVIEPSWFPGELSRTCQLFLRLLDLTERFIQGLYGIVQLEGLHRSLSLCHLLLHLRFDFLSFCIQTFLLTGDPDSRCNQDHLLCSSAAPLRGLSGSYQSGWSWNSLLSAVSSAPRRHTEWIYPRALRMILSSWLSHPAWDFQGVSACHPVVSSILEVWIPQNSIHWLWIPAPSSLHRPAQLHWIFLSWVSQCPLSKRKYRMSLWDSLRPSFIYLSYPEIDGLQGTLLWEERINDLDSPPYFLFHSLDQICGVYGPPYWLRIIIVIQQHWEILLHIVHRIWVFGGPFILELGELINGLIPWSGEKYSLEIWIDLIAIPHPTCDSKFLLAWMVHNWKSALGYSCLISYSIPGNPSAMDKRGSITPLSWRSMRTFLQAMWFSTEFM